VVAHKKKPVQGHRRGPKFEKGCENENGQGSATGTCASAVEKTSGGEALMTNRAGPDTLTVRKPGGTRPGQRRESGKPDQQDSEIRK